MPRILRSIAALVLAVIWLPSTLHCGLETAGIFGHADGCCHHDNAATGEPVHCDQGVCGVVESGDYQPTSTLTKIPAPSVALHSFCLLKLAPQLKPVPEIAAAAEVESPPEIRRTWHFAARAALSPRAPSLVG
jgi:hypothetical protein